MKKFWLTLGLSLMLVCWCGVGNYGFGTRAAFGQDYYTRGLSCNPSDPSCYNEYYAAPYADPLSQLLYYIAPPVDRDYHYQRQENYRERQDRERRDRERQDRGHQDRGHQDRGQHN
jgi:hypothetical protein